MSADQQEHSDVLAAYLPRAFAIELRSPIFSAPPPGPGLPTLDHLTFPIFMHEVAHLVQDRATFRGVMDFMDMWDQINAVSSYTRTVSKSVAVPFVDPRSHRTRLPSEYGWALELAKLRQHREPKRAWASSRFWAFAGKSIEIRDVTLAGRSLQYPFVTVHLLDNESGEEYDHVLGAWEIKEAYAVAVGLLHGGQEKQSGDSFEYLVIERILAKHFGEVSPENTVALCHWALQDLAPANTLIMLIDVFEETCGRLPHPADTYDIARREALNRDFNERSLEVVRMLYDIASNMRGQVESLAAMFQWYTTHAELLLTLHLDESRRFPLDSFLCSRSSEMSADDRTDALRRFFGEVEVPLIVWPEGEFFSIRQSADAVDAVFLNRAVSDLFHRMWSGSEPEWKCPLFDGCALPMKDEGECLTKPWLKRAHMPTCPYGAAANILGLDGEKELVHKPFPEPL